MIKRGHIPARLSKIEEKMNTGSDNLLIVLVNYEENPEEAVERAKRMNPNFVEGPGMLVLVMNYGGCREEKTTEFDDIDLQIRKETERIKKYGFKKSEIEKAIGITESPADARDVKGERDPETGAGIDSPEGNKGDRKRDDRSDFAKLFNR